jgi:PAS domain S-box-containing protein
MSITPHPIAVADPDSPRVAQKRPARILVVDGRVEMLRLIDRSLGELYECEFASDAGQARKKLGAGSFELALCDISVGGESALAFAEEIIREHAGTAVVLVTAEEDPEVAGKAFAFGAYGYLVEPLQSGQLLITVKNALRRRELEIAARALSRNVQERFQTIIDMAPISIYAKDASGRYIRANGKADELAGLQHGQLVGLVDEAFMPAEAAAASAAVDRKILAGGSSYDAEELVTIDGVERAFKTVKFPLLDVLGKVTAICGISIDVTATNEASGLRDQLSTSQAEAIDELRLSRQETVERLTKAIGLHDYSTGQHVDRIGAIASLLGKLVGLPPARVELLRLAAPMHDVGKIGTPDEILRKPGPLTSDERREMERHTTIGHDILSKSQSELLRMAASIALTHHERYDGAGYPRRLRGGEIPLEGRITAVADVFDALLSDRCYRPALSVGEAVSLIESGRGTQFDPTIVDLLLGDLDQALALRG